MTEPPATRHKVLLVDDEARNLQLLRLILQDDYSLLYAKDGMRAIELAIQERPDLILLDVMMPGMTGYETCRKLKAEPATAGVPVIFVTAITESEAEVNGFAAGAVDFLTKPVRPAIVKARVRTHLALVRLDELKQSRLHIASSLARAAEYRDNETGMHVIRMSHYARMLGLAAGLGESAADDLFNAAPLHDVGKIGVPDRILLKPGPLDPAEWDVMKRHPAIGAQIIGRHESGMLAMAHDIALTHHERWDGSGYPSGLSGNAIPIVGRIVAISDVFDALTTARPYKAAWSTEKAVDYLQEQKGRHFDELLVELFLRELPQVRAVMTRWAEH
jgi:putative two-component system response regulator